MELQRSRKKLDSRLKETVAPLAEVQIMRDADGLQIMTIKRVYCVENSAIAVILHWVSSKTILNTFKN